MLVYIASQGDTGYYLVDEYGNVARSVWFSHFIDAEDYCIENGLIIVSWED